MKSMKEIATAVAKIEGKKTQARIGEVREILSILSDMLFDSPMVHRTLFYNGKRRAKRRGAK
jgi:hypothetical protein